MPKRLRNEPINLAAGITGVIDNNGRAYIYDNIKQKNLNPDNLDDKVMIYQRQVEKWFLECATRLIKGKNNGFVILMIAVSYIEGVEQYREGISSLRQSKMFFKQGLKRIFSISPEDECYLDNVYEQVRCGLFHNGMSEGNVIISYEYSKPIEFCSNDIKINPKLFLNEIKRDFSSYISILNNVENVDATNKFDCMFSVR
jgi:hypothetical protein